MNGNLFLDVGINGQRHGQRARRFDVGLALLVVGLLATGTVIMRRVRDA